MRNTRKWQFVCVATALLALAGWDNKKCAPTSVLGAAQSALGIAPDRNVPPTDAEVFKAFMDYWRVAEGPTTPGVTPVGARQLDDSVTQDSAFGRVRTVSVVFSFRADADIDVGCNVTQRMLVVQPASPASPYRLQYHAPPGAVFTCKITPTFTKIEEGWSMHLLPFDVHTYPIRR